VSDEAMSSGALCWFVCSARRVLPPVSRSHCCSYTTITSCLNHLNYKMTISRLYSTLFTCYLLFSNSKLP